MKLLLLAVAGLFTAPLVSASEGCFSDKCTPEWFKESRKIEKAMGCNQDWQTFYWAKRNSYKDLSIGCAANGKLVVAPGGVRLDHRPGSASTTIWYHGDWSTTGNVARSPERKISYDFLYFIGGQDGPLKLQNYFRNERSRPAFEISGSALQAISVLGGGDICAWPKAISKEKLILSRGPMLCGQLKGGKLNTTSIRFGIDDVSSVHVRIHAGIASEASAQQLYAHVSAFVKTLQQN